MNKNKRVSGCLMGLATADAAGAPYEFQDFEKVTKFPTEVGTHNTPVGTWTDDTSMTLCLLDALTQYHTMAYVNQMKNYFKWYKKGFLSCDGKAIGLGRRTIEALEIFGKNPAKTVYTIKPESAGNGSLMRVAAVPLYLNKFFNEQNLTVLAKELLVGHWGRQSSNTTHGIPVCMDACFIFSIMVYRALQGKTINQIFKFSNRFIKMNLQTDEIKNIFLNKTYLNKRKDIKSSGYVVDSLNAALWSFINSTNYKNSILNAINLGGDTDTIACITGALSGAHYGIDSIPKNWLNKVRSKDTISRYIPKINF
jgi:ADP-ribosyl-[dinitrogen reductase] hydrolase